MLCGDGSEFTSNNQKDAVLFLSGCLYSYMGTGGGLSSFAIVRDVNDESLIKSRPWYSGLPRIRMTFFVYFFF